MPKPLFENHPLAQEKFDRNKAQILDLMNRAPELFPNFLAEMEKPGTGQWLEEIVNLLALSRTVKEDHIV